MKVLTYTAPGRFDLIEKPKPGINKTLRMPW